MKKSLFKFFVFATILIFANACNETLVTDEATNEELSLKSANNGKQSYVVVLQDANLDVELSNLKGYEKKQAAMKSASSRILKRAGILDGEVGFVYGTALKGFSVKIPPGQLKKLENDPAVKSVTEDQVISLGEPIYTIKNDIVSGEFVPYGITRVNGGFNYSGTNVAWIIDTGIDSDHPDLNVNKSKGASFVDGNNDPEDDEGHGTHVAGTIAAKNTGSGLVGVAAGATVIPVKVLDAGGSGAYSWIIAGVDFVAANGKAGDVANMSLGGPKYDPLNEAVIAAASKGIKFALAAGNERSDANTKSPASANHQNIYTISACDENDVWARFSNYGNPPVDFCAPGVDITSTYIGGLYATASGTSMAAPHVAGILLLGDIAGDGFVSRDKDRNPDPIAIYSGGGDPSPTNTAPVANAGSDITVTDTDGNSSELVSLDGSSSYDLDLDPISYSWSYGGEVISTAASFSYNFGLGENIVTLTVSDGDLSDQDQVVVTVNENTQGGDIVLNGEITGNKVKKVTLTWTGATGATVTLYINGEPNVISNSGSYIENLGKITGGDYVYYIVDEANVTSNTIDLSF